MRALDYLAEKFNLDLDPRRLPIEIPDVGRDDLIGWIRDLDFKVGVEIGVERGFYAEMICKFNPQLKLYAIDPWNAYEGYRDHTNQEGLERLYGYAKRRLEPMENCEIIKDFSMEAVKKFDDDSVDFVYIDGNHELPYLINDIIQWSRKVKLGGIVAGHDYYKSKRFDTKNHTFYAVNMYIQSYRIKPWFLLGERWGEPGLIRDKALSWLWVKVHDYC